MLILCDLRLLDIRLRTKTAVIQNVSIFFFVLMDLQKMPFENEDLFICTQDQIV